MTKDIPSTQAEQADEEETPAKKEKKPRRSGKVKKNVEGDKAAATGLGEDSLGTSTDDSHQVQQMQDNTSSAPPPDEHDAPPKNQQHAQPGKQPASDANGGESTKPPEHRSLASNGASNSAVSNHSAEGEDRGGVEKLLRGIFVEPIVAASSVAKDAGETALKPVKQVPGP